MDNLRNLPCSASAVTVRPQASALPDRASAAGAYSELLHALNHASSHKTVSQLIQNPHQPHITAAVDVAGAANILCVIRSLQQLRLQINQIASCRN
jgi:hypothetical protein